MSSSHHNHTALFFTRSSYFYFLTRYFQLMPSNLDKSVCSPVFLAFLKCLASYTSSLTSKMYFIYSVTPNVVFFLFPLNAINNFTIPSAFSQIPSRFHLIHPTGQRSLHFVLVHFLFSFQEKKKNECASWELVAKWEVNQDGTIGCFQKRIKRKVWGVSAEVCGSSCKNLSMMSMENKLKPIDQNVLKSLSTAFLFF